MNFRLRLNQDPSAQIQRMAASRKNCLSTNFLTELGIKS
jgi:hypothetical protein